MSYLAPDAGSLAHFLRTGIVPALSASPSDLCFICHNPMTADRKPSKVNNCGDTYCDTCIRKWATGHRHCPICKQSLHFEFADALDLDKEAAEMAAARVGVGQVEGEEGTTLLAISSVYQLRAEKRAKTFLVNVKQRSEAMAAKIGRRPSTK